MNFKRKNNLRTKRKVHRNLRHGWWSEGILQMQRSYDKEIKKEVLLLVRQSGIY
jgi:hypothetical protein